MADDELYGVPLKIKRPRLAPKEIVAIAKSVRTEHHEERLEGARIKYLIEQGQGSGHIVLGKTKKVSHINRLVSKCDFLIVLNWTMWQRLDDEKRVALLDHELTHCAPQIDEDSGEIKGWELRHHDVEEFEEIIDRRGLWTSGLQAIAKPMARFTQGELFEKVG